MSKKFNIPANTQVQQPFYTPATTPTPQFVAWKAKRRGFELSQQWDEFNLARIASGQPAVILPPNLSQEELAKLIKKIMG